MSNTLYNRGNSYGPQTADVQFAVPAGSSALGTFMRGARRINRMTITNLGDHSVTLKIQETATNPNGEDGAPSWSDVSGSSVTVVSRGQTILNVAGLINEQYARLYGSASGGSAVVRVSIDDLELRSNFRQDGVYGGENPYGIW